MTASAIRPEKELKGFEKVQLAPDETKTVTMELDKRSFAWYNTELHDWYAASGKYEILSVHLPEISALLRQSNSPAAR